MKQKTLGLLACMALLCACQPAQKQTTITGNLTGTKSDTLIVSYCPLADLNQRAMQKDTILLQQGKFTLPLANDSTPTAAYLYPLSAGKLTKSIAVVAFPGETVQVNGSAEQYNYTLTGNAFHAAWQTVKDQCRPYMLQMDSISDILVAKQQAGVAQDSIYYIYQNVYRPVMEKIQEIQKDYIRQHPDDDLSIYLLSSLGQKNAKELLPLISEKAQSGIMAPVYQAMDNALQEQKAREEARKNMVEGVTAPDFTLKDLQGKDLTLSSLRGKYVVLDFWGSWCGWCIKGIPDMKKYYEKYKDRMEILGVDCNDTEEKWKAAVEKHELPWLHVRNTDEADITVKYGIQGYPTKIVIDPEGKVAKIVVGEDPAFYKYLDELFK